MLINNFSNLLFQGGKNLPKWKKRPFEEKFFLISGITFCESDFDLQPLLYRNIFR